MVSKQSMTKTFTFIIMISALVTHQQLSAWKKAQQLSSMQSHHMNLYKEDTSIDSYLTAPDSCADFTMTSKDTHQDSSSFQLPSMRDITDFAEFFHVDQELLSDTSSLSRGLNDSYIKINADGNVDIRMTGSTTLLGRITLPFTQKNFFTGNPLIVGNDGGIGIGNLNVPGDVTITGTLNVNNIDLGDTIIFGDTHIFGQKTLNPIATLPSTTTALTLVFTNPTGTTGPLFKGANLHLQCFISGTVLGTPSVFLYTADIFVSPAITAGGTPPAIISITSALTTTIQGTLIPATITASTSGLGTTVVLSFGSLLAMTNQAVTLFYEITSDNLTSVS